MCSNHIRDAIFFMLFLRKKWFCIPKALDITGRKFGNLTAIEKAQSKNGKTYWLCRCECGKEKEIQTIHLTSGVTTSCGCKKANHLIDDGIERKLICPICESEFITRNQSRAHCFNCRPEGLSDTEGLRSKKRALKHRLIEYKGSKCKKCGYNKCEGALQFHHVDPSKKDFTIAQVNLSTTISIQDIFNELDKCDLLCANCHAEIHFTG